MKEPRDASKWTPLCAAMVYPGTPCHRRGDCATMDDLVGYRWRVSVDEDGIAWTWSTET